ncbi:MAG TPA: taurine ABC transporter substrate-binding protein [Geminicoccaceae bacterium]|nr:taurine ABC transporter substrate-binding protein [Geminicoccaceae bacterium]
MRRRTLLELAAGSGLLAAAPRRAAAAEATIGYQLLYNPMAMAIATGRFEEETGWSIRWHKFDSGARVIGALASGELQIGVAGSSPIAAGASRGVDLQLFWIVAEIADAEALVVRDGTGIEPADPATLGGRRIGVPFGSTTHFHMLFALELWGMAAGEVTLLDMQPNQIVAAWERGDIDASFVWDPARGRLLRSGRVMITSGELSERGRATFDGLIASREFAQGNRELMAKLVKVLAEADAAYRDAPAAWTPDSPEVQAIVRLVGGDPAEVPEVLSLYRFPPLTEQVSPRWLGGGAEGGAARALRHTAEFLKAQGRLDALQPDYARFVTPEHAEEALKLGG